MQHFSENYWKKRFPAGKRANGPKKRRTGKRANEIECPEKGKGTAPDLKSEARAGIPGLQLAFFAQRAIP